ncbi:MAG: putative transrane cytochrome oxidase complex biosis factor [Francisellaceae bacterium]|nr:putative transrane cytochrome oxidase complex biosis factor [Francisellaceae bacterium]
MKNHSVHPKRRIFTKYLPSTLSAIIIIAILVKLGLWQLDRFQEKKILEKKMATLKTQPVLNNDFLPLFHQDKNIKDTFLFKTFELKGHYLNSYHFWLDNQIYKHAVGYRVLTLFKPNNVNYLIIVDRGFIKAEQTRDKLPQIFIPQGIQTIKGHFIKSNSGLKFASHIEKMGLDQFRIQNIDIPQLENLVKNDIFPLLIKRKPPEQGLSFQAISLPISSNKHLGYAIQWFTMAIVVLIYYLVINLKKGEM